MNTADKKKITKKRKYTTDIDSLARRVSKIQRSIEYKSRTVNYTGSQIDSAGAIASLPIQITAGSAYNERIGNKIKLKSIQYNIWVYLPTTALSGNGAFDLVLDKCPQLSLPSMTNIYYSTEPTALIRWDRKQRFSTIFHHHFAYGQASVDSKGHVFDGYKKIPITIVYTASGGNHGDIENGKNDLLLIWRSSNTSAGSTSYGTVSNFRMVYSDL